MIRQRSTARHAGRQGTRKGLVPTLGARRRRTGSVVTASLLIKRGEARWEAEQGAPESLYPTSQPPGARWLREGSESVPFAVGCKEGEVGGQGFLSVKVAGTVMMVLSGSHGGKPRARMGALLKVNERRMCSEGYHKAVRDRWVLRPRGAVTETGCMHLWQIAMLRGMHRGLKYSQSKPTRKPILIE